MFWLWLILFTRLPVLGLNEERFTYEDDDDEEEEDPNVVGDVVASAAVP